MNASESFQDRLDAWADDAEITALPKRWTPEHVIERLVEGFDVLKRTPARLGPAGPSTAWPVMRIDPDGDDEDLVARAKKNSLDLAELIAEKAEREAAIAARAESQKDEADKRPPPTPHENSRAMEALGWCLTYLRDEPLLADALQLYCRCTAHHVSAAKALRDRRLEADIEVARHNARVVEDRRDGMLQQEIKARTDAVDPLVKRRQSDIDAAVAAQRREIIARAVSWANSRLVGADAGKAENVKANARIRAERDNAAVAGERVRRQDVRPGKVFSRRMLDFYRKAGAQAISDALHRDGVDVR